MADITANANDWNVTEASNPPSGGTIAGGGIDDNLRALEAGVKKALCAIGSDMAVGSTINLATANGNTINVTGTGSSVTGLGTVAAGARFRLIFAAANTLVHSANFVLPGGTNIAVSAGDQFEFVSRGSGAWTCIGALPNTQPGGVPVGTPIPWLAAAVPTGYILAYGQTVSRTTYAALFAVFGTVFNTGGEAGTDFRMPDLRGRFLAGLDNMGGSAASRISTYATATTPGNTGGSENPAQHSHPASSADALGAHNHTISGTASGTVDAANTDHYHSISLTSGDDSPDHSHNYQIVGGAGGTALGSGTSTETTTTSGANTRHQHPVSGNSASQSGTGFGNYQHGHTATLSLSASAANTSLTHQHSVTVSNSGTGLAGNLPPVMFVNWAVRAL